MTDKLAYFVDGPSEGGTVFTNGFIHELYIPVPRDEPYEVSPFFDQDAPPRPSPYDVHVYRSWDFIGDDVLYVHAGMK